jgi:tripartite-type tricarboxylate transporter receptor subunit TctC
VFEWPGLVAPAGTPVAIVNRIQQEVARTVSDAEIKKKIADVGSSAVGSMPEEFGKLIRSELAKWAKVASGMASTGTSDAPTK